MSDSSAGSRQGLLGRGATRLLSDGSLTKKASLNAIASGVDYAARVVVGLVLNPILLSRLGESMFGVWQVLLRLLGQVGPASGRPGEALKWKVAHDQSSSDLEAKRRQVGNAAAVWLLFLPIQLAFGALLGWFAPVWLGVPGGTYPMIRLAAALLVVDMVLASLTDLPRAVLQGENLAYKRLGLSTSLVFIGGVLVAVALFLGGGIVGVAVATVATTVLSGVVYLFIVRTRVHWFGFARPHWHDVRGFLGLSWWFLVWNLVMKVMKGADVVVLGIAGSTSLVTDYTLARYVPQAAGTGLMIGIASIMPGLGGLIGARDLDRARSVRNEMLASTWLAGTVAGTLILLWEESFLLVWVGEGYYPGSVAMSLIVVMILQWGLIRVDSNIIDLTLRLRAKVLLGVLSAGLAVGLSSLLIVRGGGIEGLVVGFIAGRAILTIAYPWLIGKFLGVSPGRQLVAAVRPAVATTGMLAIAAVLASMFQVDSWLELALWVAVSAAVAGPLAFFAGLGTRERERLWNRARRVARFR
jgi:O-antigen/teichoic acid export membrane protein